MGWGDLCPGSGSRQAWGWQSRDQALPAPAIPHQSRGHLSSKGLHQLPAGTPRLQERSRGCTDALLLPVLPRLKMGRVNQRTEPRTPKTVLWRGAGHSTGGGRELQKLGLVGAGFCRQALAVGPRACWVVVLGGSAGGLHFWGFPCSLAPSWALGIVRGRAEGSKGRGRGAARELWVIICY